MRITRPARRRIRSRAKTAFSGGFTLLELLGAVSLFAMASLGFVGVVLSAKSLEEETHARAEAVNLARKVIEAMQAVEFSSVFATFNEDPADDPEGIGTAIGGRFDRQLFSRTFPQHAQMISPPPQGGEDYPYVARVSFPMTGPLTGELREDLNLREWPSLDLNADGEIDSLSHAEDYVILPVRVSVDWTTPRGARNLELGTILMRK